MIDTIRLRTKLLKPCDNERFLQISAIKENNIKYKIFKDQINVGSFSYNINIFINSLNFLFIEFSLPKLLYGNNLELAFFSDLLPALRKIEKTLSDYLSLKDCTVWEVMRLDMCKYIKSDNPYRDIHMFQMLDYPRQKKYIYDTSVMFVGRSYSSKFYIKEDEYFKHDFKKISKHNPSLAYNVLELSKGKIRFETGYRSQALKQILDLQCVTVQDILDKELDLRQHFYKIYTKLYGDIDPKRMEQNSLLELLQQQYKPTRALQLYQFYVLYYSDDFNKKIVKENYSRSQIYRNLKAIKRAII